MEAPEGLTSRQQILRYVAGRLRALAHGSTLRVAVDGVDGVGKTVLPTS